ncbi:MAG: hypothetical protein M0036_09625 [Desulfobacteraceae bacterium]|nr:hypothetical protein [Desulfobacteraceae bacterium]
MRLKLEDDPTGQSAGAAAFIEGAGPYAQILEGTLTADGKGILAELLLLVQPDHSTVASSELRPISNVQVDQLWQTAWQRLKGDVDGDPPAALPCQVDAEGALIPFRPLFYCRHRDRYAHPLCPQCGGDLTVCRDDELLRSAGLPLYSQSLERFLFCPDCQASQSSATFYTSLAQSGQAGAVHGSAQLIEGFSALLAKDELSSDLPCVGCVEAPECYGAKTLVHQRMTSLFFYPFFMLLRPATSINTLEFLSVMSGAPIEEAAQQLLQSRKRGRLRKLVALQTKLAAGSGLLFNGERRFLETLFLKLSFLEALSDLVLKADGPFSIPVADMSLESVWVHLPAVTPRLPLFWNFSLEMIDMVGRPAPSLSQQAQPESQARFFLGTAWFYVLLVNGDQNMSVVQSAIDQVLSSEQGVSQLENDSGPELDPVLAPSNLVWLRDVKTIHPEWHGIWRRVLALGLGVLRSGMAPDSRWSANGFKAKLSEIKSNVRELLFSAPAPAAVTAKAVQTPTTKQLGAPASSDRAIADLLQSILAQWPKPKSPKLPNAAPEAKPVKEAQIPLTASLHPNADGDFEETVILGTASFHPKPATATHLAPPALEETVVMGAQPRPEEKSPTPMMTEDSQATVIIPTPNAPGSSSVIQSKALKSAPATPAKPVLEETVLMPGGQNDKILSTPPEDDLPATRIITPGQMPITSQPPSRIQPIKAEPKSAPTDELEQTIALEPFKPGMLGHGRTVAPPTPPLAKQPPKKSAVSQPSPDADGLEATVFIPPGENKERTPRK